MSISQLESAIELLSGRDRPDNPTVEQTRDGFQRMMKHVGGDTPADVSSMDIGGVPSMLVRSERAQDAGVTLYLHGGGYVIGSPTTHLEMAKRLSAASGGAVLLLDYRMAPENPFPAAVEDSVSAYRALLESNAPEQISIAGDSAGGGLTAATLVSLRYTGVPLPSCGVCISPWVDLEGIGNSMNTRAGVDPMVQRDGLVSMATTYLGGASPRTPLAAPLYADLIGLPPLLIQVGTRETLYDDATRLAERARSSGVEVEFEAWEEMIHVWHLFAPMLDEGEEAIRSAGNFIRSKRQAAALGS